ncbi:hypothetical protein RCL_jg7221.t1 [Rhizophagus clarus]|uniref:Uncharacterized protein n=1 Tax=Rhizophagus clarus TaxID=94130 RepID=A0A8H3QZ37_9GLOM|nr:hypothetical protein RCL_jg7221.t1 [Rhizophagus clarus]
MPQRFSIGYRSGLLKGQSITSGILSRIKFLSEATEKQYKLVFPFIQNPPHARIFTRSLSIGRIGRCSLYQRSNSLTDILA